MSESARNPGETTSPAEAFIQLWGDMGAHWGVPRTMTLVHALLFVEGRPLNTDDVMGRLGISRGNASMTLRTLVDWGLATRSHNPTDRKDYFAAGQDAWQLFCTVVRVRKSREVRPLVDTLQGILDGMPASGDAAHRARREKLADIARLAQLLDGLAEQVLSMGPSALSMLDARADRA